MALTLAVGRGAVGDMSQPARQLVVSFHDLHPGSRAEAERFVAGCAAVGITQISLLVVPRMHGAPLWTSDRAFVGYLQGLVAAGHDLVLHGWLHLAETSHLRGWDKLVATRYTAGEGEFHRLGQAEAARRLHDGLAAWAEAGLPLGGFTPPAWLLGPEAEVALRATPLRFTTVFGGIQPLPGPFVPAPVVTWSSRAGWRRWAARGFCPSWAWWNRQAPILRVAVHPIDFRYPEIERNIFGVLRQAVAQRTSTTYAAVAEAYRQSPAVAPAR